MDQAEAGEDTENDLDIIIFFLASLSVKIKIF